MLTYEDALYYKTLCQCGLFEMVDKWIDTEVGLRVNLDGIFLDLACCYGDLSKIISVLHQYIGDNKVDNKIVCDKLRSLIYEKYNNGEINIEQAMSYIFSFSDQELMYEDYWRDFSNLSILYNDFCENNPLFKQQFYQIFLKFLSTGIYDNINFFGKNKVKNKNKTKFFIKWGIGLFLYSILVFILSGVILKLYVDNVGPSNDTVFSIYTTSTILLILIPVLMFILARALIYEFFSKEGKSERRKRNLELEEISKKRESDSLAIREKYKLPNDILTEFEYNKKYADKPTKKKLIIMVIFELICLILTLGAPIYFELLNNEISFTLLMIGIVFGIYGFCVLCSAPKKGIIYSCIPVLCYAIPLVIVYYGYNCSTEWILALSTILVGSLLLFIFILYIAIIPNRLYRRAEIQYINDFVNKYGEINIDAEYYYGKKYITLFLDNGHKLLVVEYDENNSILIILGFVCYNGINLKNQILSYQEVEKDFDSAIELGINKLRES